MNEQKKAPKCERSDEFSIATSKVKAKLIPIEISPPTKERGRGRPPSERTEILRAFNRALEKVSKETREAGTSIFGDSSTNDIISGEKARHAEARGRPLRYFQNEVGGQLANDVRKSDREARKKIAAEMLISQNLEGVAKYVAAKIIAEKMGLKEITVSKYIDEIYMANLSR
jgi:hypothetical protein